MCRHLALLLLCSLLVDLPGCNKRETSSPAPRDVCGLITLDEIQTTQGSSMSGTKNSARSDGGFRMSQCFYTATEFSKSVNLAVVERDPDHPGKRSPRDFWKEKFDPYQNEEPKTKTGEEKEQGPAPKKIDSTSKPCFASKPLSCATHSGVCDAVIAAQPTRTRS